MKNNHSGRPLGSSLGAVAGAIIIMAFFLPWVQACGTEMTGYDLATNSSGLVEEAWQYWLVPATGVLLVIFFALFKTHGFGSKVGLGIGRLVVGLLGFLPVLNVWRNVQQKNGAMEVLYGGWILIIGFTLVFLSFVLDIIPFGDD